ncbi:MAG: NAD(P)-dependent oxidoreductase [Bacteroidaceae bacterium]|nr:NAD(P)-dependent oxidoreductase [Bacteroidaceae bacterium]
MADRILITGGSGFIGTHLVSHFEREFEVLSIDVAAPKIASHESHWRAVDITDADTLRRIVDEFNPHYILHLAARTDLGGKNIDDYAANTVGTRNVLAVAKTLPALRKIIITSSMLVCHVGYQPHHQKDYAATTFYGESKAEAERLTWEAELNCDWAIIRPTSIWGPWFGEPYRNFFDLVKRRAYFHIGHASCTKTYGYVGNAVYQIDSLLHADTRAIGNKIFYIGDRPATNIEEWGDEIAAELHFKIHHIPLWIVRCAAWTGDVLKKFGIRFPMTSFRLRNMSTDNVIDLTNTYAVAPTPPYDRLTGVRETLKWLETH